MWNLTQHLHWQTKPALVSGHYMPIALCMLTDVLIYLLGALTREIKKTGLSGKVIVNMIMFKMSVKNILYVQNECKEYLVKKCLGSYVSCECSGH